MTTLVGAERRRSERHAMVRPCKVRDRRSLLFSPGQTSDLSDEGALLRLEGFRPFAQGDEVELLVAWAHEGVLSSDSLVQAKVVRVIPIDFHHQAVAIQFGAPGASPARVAA